MSGAAKAWAREIWTAIGGAENALESLSITGRGALPSAYPVTDFAAAAAATAALSILELIGRSAEKRLSAVVDRRLSSLWFGLSIRPDGWKLPPIWDPVAGDYQTSDGWIRLHTNAPHHRAAAEKILGSHGDKASMARAVVSWKKAELESAIVEAGGCAAEMLSTAEWSTHPQGRAVAAEPLAIVAATGRTTRPSWSIQPERPLKGVRVLDLTRVLAGPVATRFLAGYGADVLRVDPPGWDEAAIVPEVTLGKRCIRLDLHDAPDRTVFEELLSQADIFIHGYRPGALDRLGFDHATRDSVMPGLIDVCLDAYGWSGPWASRRGFDSLVQMSTGIADAGMRWRNADKPVPLPVQALDHATGYLIAATAIRALTERVLNGNGSRVRLSLARTAKLLVDARGETDSTPLAAELPADLSPTVEATHWGPARRVLPPINIEHAPMSWDYPARELGWAEARWA